MASTYHHSGILDSESSEGSEGSAATMATAAMVAMAMTMEWADVGWAIENTLPGLLGIMN